MISADSVHTDFPGLSLCVMACVFGSPRHFPSHPPEQLHHIFMSFYWLNHNDNQFLILCILSTVAQVCAGEHRDTVATITRENMKKIKSEEVITKPEENHTCVIAVQKPWTVLLCVHPLAFPDITGEELYYV